MNVMKRTAWLVMVMVVVMAGLAFAADTGTLNMFRAKAATGAGATTVLPKVYQSWACQADITGAPTAVTISAEGNIRGTTYSTLQSHAFTAEQLTATQALFSFDAPVRQIRGNLVTLTAGTTPTVTMVCVGME
jgi:hypothetical protein